jgi:MoaA/NifB/PqqE/SkfB family radical SAM enzyme
VFEYEGKRQLFFPSVGLKLTGACRLKCPFCCEPDREQSVYALEKFVAITNVLHEVGTKRLCFTGGEPLMYPWLQQILMHTYELGFHNLLLTSDGGLLKQKYNKILPFVHAVRFSVHATAEKHDGIVGEVGAFFAIDEMIDLLTSKGCNCYVTTVVSKDNFGELLNVAEWCFSKGVKQLYLFGLMKSGRGIEYINITGEVPAHEISEAVEMLQARFDQTQMEIVYYDYQKNSECVLIYGDGRMVIDPYPKAPTFQADIGNILTQNPSEIMSNFNQDPENLKGYSAHLDTIPKLR